MNAKEEYEQKMEHYTAILREKAGDYKVDGESSAVFKWRVYHSEAQHLQEFIEPDRTQIAGDKSNEQLRHLLHPLLKAAIKKLESKRAQILPHCSIKK